ncbi:MAG TPA: PDZ domain-containing protein [Candidatus Dormibacteraeota bacterium]|nr:PDZ domain-containing protein [Candidatus Dormibacteraeota bacterium]
MRIRISLTAILMVLVLVCAGIGSAAEEKPLLAQQPTINKTEIVFVYGGYLWSVPREGGAARQLTTGGHESHPSFSPDGKWIAFSGNYDGNRDVYVMPAEGGAPTRLTWHPGEDDAVGWTPDGKRVLFASERERYADFVKFYTVPKEGGVPEALPMWRANEGSYSPDGTQMAYVPNFQWQEAWKRYRGGQTTPIYIVRLSDLHLERVPRDNSNDSHPVWFKDTVYFLSDRNGPVTLFAYDSKAKTVQQVIENNGLDFKSLSAGPDALVYEQFGGVFIYDPQSGKTQRVNIQIAGDLPATRPHWTKVGDKIQNAGISPTGARAVFEARGEILTAPAEKGDVRNLTRTTGVAERDPAWSPDGKWIAFFSDESGEYALHLVDQSGLGEVKKINLGMPPSFFYGPTWSPDSKKIAYADKRLNLWYVDIEKGVPVKVATTLFDVGPSFSQQWSPDSKWITYAKFLPNHYRAVYVYSVESGKGTQLTDGMSDVAFPVFDRGGKYLYFTASTDEGLGLSFLDLSGFQRPVSRSVYAIVLKKTDANPVEPQSDDEKIAEKKDEEKGKEADKDKGKDKDKDKDKDKAKDADKDKKEEEVKVTFDFEGIGQRIVALPIKAANYVGMDAGKAGILFLGEIPSIPSLDGPTLASVSKFDLSTRKTEPFVSGISEFSLSANGEKALYRQGPPQGGQWFIAATAAAPKPGEGQLKLDGMEVYIDPRAEWNQMYHEVWRIERDFFYAPNFHGLNLAEAEKKYAPYLSGVGGRNDLTHLFVEMLGELTVGHMFVFGGDVPEAPKVKGGLLGADYKVENGRYRFARIFNGENWNPQLRAPLTQPGVDVRVGDYLIEVNGREVRAPQEVYSFFENTAGTQIKIKVGPNADGKDAREVTVVPVDNEFDLRNRAWEEDNRRKVDELSGGKLAYVHVPDTANGGYVNFNRFYLAQEDKQGAIIDERYNHGGAIADYIVDLLGRPLRNCVTSREGEKYCSPMAQIYGPKTMIINEMSGSGGDALPWMFRQDKLGPLVGTRTWGGLVGIGGYPPLLDGGYVMAPREALYGLHGQWEVENHGVAPDIEVENDPASVAAGHDAQLEKAVEVTLEALKKNPVVIPDHPPYPDYHQK